MLAQNFKTPTDLGITDAEFDALHKVLGMLERAELPFADLKRDRVGNWLAPEGGAAFNMAQWECGTAHCIGGWAGRVDPSIKSDLITKTSADGKDGLSKLFYPSPWTECRWSGGLGDITDQHAAIALRNYLTHGEPRWAEALTA